MSLADTADTGLREAAGREVCAGGPGGERRSAPVAALLDLGEEPRLDERAPRNLRKMGARAAAAAVVRGGPEAHAESGARSRGAPGARGAGGAAPCTSRGSRRPCAPRSPGGKGRSESGGSAPTTPRGLGLGLCGRHTAQPRNKQQACRERKHVAVADDGEVRGRLRNLLDIGPVRRAPADTAGAGPAASDAGARESPRGERVGKRVLRAGEKRTSSAAGGSARGR